MEFAYKYLLLATGSGCRRLSLPGSELDGLHYLRNVVDARRLRGELHPGRRVVVVGGGVVGLEVAGSAVARGCRVVVIETAPHVMGRVVPPDMAEAIEEMHRARGVMIRTATQPTAFEGANGRINGIALSTGEVVPADVVVGGVGAIPRTDLASDAGLVVDNGLVVNEYFRSSDEHMFAAGDVANVKHVTEGCHIRVEHWRAALDQGARVAANMLGVGTPYGDTPWMWSDQQDFHFQATGFGFDRASAIVRRGAATGPGGVTYFGLSECRLVAACGMSMGAEIGRPIRIAQLLIERASVVDPERLADPKQDLKSLVRPTRRRWTATT